MDFDFSALRRFPDVEAPNLQAWDATDELLVQAALDTDFPESEIAVIGDEYGAIALALTALRRASLAQQPPLRRTPDAESSALAPGIRVHQDLVTGRRALANNAAHLGLELPQGHELDERLLAGARLVLLQLPKSLAELEEIADAVARWAASDVTLIAGGRVKHMTLAQNDVLARYFGAVQPQRAARKSRLITASAALPVPSTPPFPVSQTHRLGEKPLSARDTTSARVSHAESGFSRENAAADPGTGGGTELTLCAHGGAFAGAKLDIGTRALLEVLPQIARDAPESGATGAQAPTTHTPLHAIDLGCGTGALAAAFALQHPDAVITATDRSAAAVRSASATMQANGIADRVTVTLDDAGSALPEQSADIILLNPPFHLGASVHEGAGRRLIEAAARLTREGGEVWTVFNSHLDHRRALSRDVGPTEQVARTSKFTITRSIRRG